MTFAVIKTGGKQYKVAANDVVKIEKIAGEPGDVVTFDQVLLVGEGDDVTVGAPLVEGALVAGQFIATEKQRTVIISRRSAASITIAATAIASACRPCASPRS
jgi:large subunit ribosomal protein L21